MGSGVQEYWRIGELENWSIGVLEYWSIGVLEYWSAGLAEHADTPIRVPLRRHVFPQARLGR
jgi:hypothetical protein